MLEVKTKEQEKSIERICDDDIDLIYVCRYGLRVDSWISFEKMKAIVKYLENTNN